MNNRSRPETLNHQVHYGIKGVTIRRKKFLRKWKSGSKRPGPVRFMIVLEIDEDGTNATETGSPKMKGFKQPPQLLVVKWPEP